MNKQTAYVEKLSAQLVELDNRIDRLKDRAKNTVSEPGAEESPALAALQGKRAQIAEKLQGISASGDRQWEGVKSGSEQVWEEVNSLVRDAIVNIK